MSLARGTWLRRSLLPLNCRRGYSTIPKSTYYIQRFVNSDDQYLLLLPESSTPMGRLKVSTTPETSSSSQTGPTIDFIDPISPEELKKDWTTFIENGGFREILQAVVAENISQEQVVINDALSLPTGEGWVHLCDERALPAFGRIPEPEDIIGSVLVKEGKLRPETYQGMPTYRLMTREGPMKLSDFLLGKLREKLRSG